MTDYERSLEFFESLGIKFENSNESYRTNTYIDSTNGNQIIQICNDDKNEKVTGYRCFFTEMKFDSSGKFIEIGAWE